MKFFLLIVIFIISTVSMRELKSQNTNVDSLENVLLKSETDIQKIDLLIEIGQNYEKYSLQKALKYYRQANEISNKIEDSSRHANALFNIGVAYSLAQKYNQAYELYKKSLKIYLIQKDSIHIADLYKNIGDVFLLTSVYDSALYYELEAIRIYQIYDNYLGVIDSYMILGALSTQIDNFYEAEYYFEQAMNFAVEIDNEEYKCILFNDIGLSFARQKNYDLAILNYKKALFIAKENGIDIYLGDIYKNMANAYLSGDKSYISITYYYKAKRYYEKFNNIDGIFGVSMGLAKVYFSTGYNRTAYGFLLKAKSIEKNYNSYLSLKDKAEFYDIYSKILFNLGQNKKAYEALRQKVKFQDSFMSERKIKLVYELEFKYQTISKNKTIKDLQKINILNKEILDRQKAARKSEKKIFLLIIFIGIILIIASLLIFYNFLKNRKLSKKIQEKNQKIYDAQEKLKRVVDFLPVAFFETDAKGNLVFKNQNFSEMSSVTDDIGGIEAYIDFIKPEYRRNVISIISLLNNPGEIKTVEFEYIRKDNTSFWALMSVALNQFNGNKEFYGMVIDISERKKIEQDLLLLQTSVEQSESALMITDSVPKIVYVNSAYCKICGYKEYELLGKNPSFLNSGLTSESIYIDLWETILSGNVWKGVFLNKKKNGEIYSDKSIIAPVKNKIGIITHFVANKEDITVEMRKNEKILKLFTATENSPNSVIILDNQLRITYVNKAFEKITGYKADEVYGLKPDFLNSSENDSKMVEVLEESIYKGNVWQGMLINIRKNGEKYWDSSTVIPLLNEDKKLIGFVCNDTDVTKEIKTQEELMDTMEQLNEKNEEIYSSIRYAERIQKIMMSNDKEIKELFPNSFILFLPRDIISGDFYWVSKVQNKRYIAIVDCTGHSVPGAFLSIIGMNLLDSAINERKIEKPSEVLHYMSEKLYGLLSNPYTLEHIKDDMEVALVELNYDENELIFASSRNRMYYISDKPTKISYDEKGISIVNQNETKIMCKFNGDREFLGSKVFDRSFTDYKVKIKNRDMLFFSSDGYYDQFGGDGNVKYKRKNFEKKLFEISDLPIDEQKEFLLNEFERFKGSLPQTDDVTVLGLRIVL